MDQTVNLTSLTSVVRIYLFPPPKSDTLSGVAFWLRKGNCRSAGSAVVRASGAGQKLSSLLFLFLSRRDALAPCASMYLFLLINIHRHSRWFFIFGLLALYYQQRASRAYDELAVMRLLLATRKRAFLVLNFLHLWLCPSFIFFLIFLLSCLLFYPCFFFFFCFFLIPFSSAFFCSSAKPLLNPRTIRGF